MASRPTSPWCKEIKKALIDKDMSISDLADVLKKRRPYVSSIINGRIYSEEVMKEISDYLKVPYVGTALASETSISGKAGGENGERLHE